MNKLKILRNSLQIFSLLIFLYQTGTFLQRYHESPTIIIMSQKVWDESYRPRIMVCDSKLYNYTKSRQIGYQWFSSLISGDVIGFNNSISWKGNSNYSWNEIESYLFPNINNNISDITILGNQTKLIKLKHLQPLSICYEILDFSQILSLGLVRDVSIYMIDPHRFTNHRLNTLSMRGDNIAFKGINKTSYASYNVYSITTTLLEKRADKENCQQYPAGSGYSNCVENGYFNLFQNLLGCVPPWFRHENNNSVITCTKQIHFKDEKRFTEAKAQLKNITINAQFMKNIKCESNWCLPACTQTYYHVELGRSEEMSYKHNTVEIQFADVINVETETNGYDSFRLIIEVGSSLGLWLGLCIFALFDLMIESMGRLQGLFKPRIE